MNEIWINMCSIAVTITLAVAAGAIKICSKLEKIQTLIQTFVTREECAENRKHCRFYLKSSHNVYKKR